MLKPNSATVATHHDLDIKPIPEQVLYINEPGIAGDFCGMGISDLDDAQWLAKVDDTCDNASWYAKQSLDHIRVFIPLDLSRKTILAYFRAVMVCFGHANEENEAAFSSAIDQVVTRLEIYDQVWLTREMSRNHAFTKHHGNESDIYHSQHASEIARIIVDELVHLGSDGCTAECFPYESVEMLCKEYSFEMAAW
jgi:hypothetical protein